MSHNTEALKAAQDALLAAGYVRDANGDFFLREDGDHELIPDVTLRKIVSAALAQAEQPEPVRHCRCDGAGRLAPECDGAGCYAERLNEKAEPAEKAQPVAYRWRFLEGKDRTWRHCETQPGFDPRIVECEPLYAAPPAAPQQAVAPEGWREAVQRLVTGFEHVSGIARQWEPDYSSGADRAKWARATEACADVARMLSAAPTQAAPPLATSTLPRRLRAGWLTWCAQCRRPAAAGATP